MTPEEIRDIAGLLVAIIGSIGLVPLVNWLKGIMNIDGGKAQILAGVVSLIVAVLSAVAAGDLTLESISGGNAAVALLGVWIISQEIYKRLTADEGGGKQ